MAESDSLDHQRFQLERDKLRFERQKFAIEVRFRKLEQASPKSIWKDILANPVSLAIVGGFLTLMSGIATTTFTARANREAEALRAKYTRDSANDTLQADLIKKFVEGPSRDAVRGNLQFLVDAGLLPSYAAQIQAYLKNNPGSAPQVSSSGSFGSISKSALQQILDEGYLLGVDMSSFNAGVSLAALKERGVKFAFLKATQGAGYVSPTAANQATRARENGLKIGLYHFFTLGTDADAQFANFSSQLTAIPWDLPPVIDCEDDPTGAVRAPTPDYASRVASLARKLEERFGVRPIIYTSQPFGQKYLDQQISKYPLFIASYKQTKPAIPNWWTDYAFWQVAFQVSDDPVLGRLDVVAFKGGEKELIALSAGKIPAK